MSRSHTAPLVFRLRSLRVMVLLSLLFFVWFSIQAPTTMLQRVLQSMSSVQCSASPGGKSRTDNSPRIPQEEEINAHPDRVSRGRSAFSAPPPRKGSSEASDEILSGRIDTSRSFARYARTSCSRGHSPPLFLVHQNFRA